MFKVSRIRVLVAAFGYGLGSLFFLLIFEGTGSWFFGFFGAAAPILSILTIRRGWNRPTLELSSSGLSWAKEYFSWQEIRTFNAKGSGGNRFLSLYFEGNEKPFVPSGNQLRDLWRKLFPEEQPFAIDISYFTASNDEIEDAMDVLYFPARGLEFDEDDHLFDKKSK